MNEDPFRQITNLQKRTGGAKIAFASDTNAIIDALNTMNSLPSHGPAPEGGAPFSGGVPVIVVSSRTAYGQYNVNVTFYGGAVPDSGTTVLSDLMDDAENYFPAVLLNQGETGKATHYIGADSIVHAFPTGLFSSDGLPVYITNFTHAIRDIRYNSDTGWIQVTYNDGDSVPEEDWVNKIEVFVCEDA